MLSSVQRNLPLQGSIDLTYRCTNACRHCWIVEPDSATTREQELSTTALSGIVDEARAMGCRGWAISGGEPLLRPDFAELFAHITDKAIRYTLNTNGVLITPALARLFSDRPHGAIMIAIYGATADVHDHITRTPGSFDAAMAGIAHLRDIGAAFIIQIIPLRDNYHQYQAMVTLAQSLTPLYRIGAPWLYLSATGTSARNDEIRRQRLSPEIAVQLDTDEHHTEEAGVGQGTENDRSFSACIAQRHEFHLDPYGGMSFCSRLVDPSLRYDLRTGSFRQGWDEFIPALGKATERPSRCQSCDSRAQCKWCPANAYLESRDYLGIVPYLCDMARVRQQATAEWQQAHTRYFRLGGLTVKVTSDVPVTERTFSAHLAPFQVEALGEDTVTLCHHFSLPDISGRQLGERVSHYPPTSLYRHPRGWIYLQCEDEDLSRLQCIAEYSSDHMHGDIYYPPACQKEFQGGLRFLTGFLADQAILARVFADRQACYLHSSGMIINGRGVVFIGHSGAGKTTTLRMLGDMGEILSDDRNIVRRWPQGFRVHGTWLHGDIAEVSPADAPLHALCFIEQASANELVPITDAREVIRRLLLTVIKPYACADWWQKTLTLLEQLSQEVPAYRLRLDTSGAVREIIGELTKNGD